MTAGKQRLWSDDEIRAVIVEAQQLVAALNLPTGYVHEAYRMALQLRSQVTLTSSPISTPVVELRPR